MWKQLYRTLSLVTVRAYKKGYDDDTHLCNPKFSRWLGWWRSSLTSPDRKWGFHASNDVNILLAGSTKTAGGTVCRWRSMKITYSRWKNSVNGASVTQFKILINDNHTRNLTFFDNRKTVWQNIINWLPVQYCTFIKPRICNFKRLNCRCCAD